MTNVPLRVGQYALITNPEGELLILKRTKSKKWSLPGGRLEDHERDWLSALNREIFEETGMTIENAEPIKINIVEDLPHQIKYCVYFQANLKEGVEVNLTEEHSCFMWINKSNCGLLKFEYLFVQNLVAEYLKKG